MAYDWRNSGLEGTRYNGLRNTATPYNVSEYTGSDENYHPRKIGAYHMIGDDSYEPQRNNNFEIRIYDLYNLYTVEAGRHISENNAYECLTLSAVSVGAINTNVGVLPIAYGNTKVKYAGLPDVQDSTVVYNDYIGKGTERIIAAWHALVFNPQTEVIGRASQYKKPADLIEFAPDGSTARVWRLKGVWPSTVSYGDYDYNGGQVRQINLTLTYDIAIPLDNDNSYDYIGSLN